MFLDTDYSQPMDAIHWLSNIQVSFCLYSSRICFLCSFSFDLAFYSILFAFAFCSFGLSVETNHSLLPLNFPCYAGVVIRFARNTKLSSKSSFIILVLQKDSIFGLNVMFQFTRISKDYITTDKILRNKRLSCDRIKNYQ